MIEFIARIIALFHIGKWAGEKIVGTGNQSSRNTPPSPRGSNGCLQAFGIIFGIVFALLGAFNHMPAVTRVIFLAVGIGMILLVVRGSRKSQAQAALAWQQIQDAKAELTKWNQDTLSRIANLDLAPDQTSPSGLILNQGEGWYYHAWGVNAMTMQTRHVQQGGYVGSSIPIGESGLAIDLGNYNCTSVPVTQLASVGQGNVYITNQRIVFVGSDTSVAFALSDIVRLSAYEDGMRLDIANRKPWVFKTGNIELAGYTYRAIHG